MWALNTTNRKLTQKAVAQITKGEYFHAATGADLKKVYEELNSRFVMEKRETEITALFSAAAALLASLAAGLHHHFNALLEHEPSGIGHVAALRRVGHRSRRHVDGAGIEGDALGIHTRLSCHQGALVVTDRDGHLLGALNLHDLFAAKVI